MPLPCRIWTRQKSRGTEQNRKMTILFVYFCFLVICYGEWIHTDIPATMINFTCPFSVVGWNCYNFAVANSQERGSLCSRYRYLPPDPDVKFFRVDAVQLFRKYNGSSIYFDGDSITGQHFVDFSCRLLPWLESYDMPRLPARAWCNIGNICHEEKNNNGPFLWARATFRFERFLIHTHVRTTYANIQDSLLFDKNFRANLKAGDVFVANFGMHFSPTEITDKMVTIADALDQLKKMFVSVFWRETTASHFGGTVDRSGYWSPFLRQKQERFEAECVDYFELDFDQAWLQSRNANISKYLTERGIRVLKVWNATFFAPSICHVGGGRDCLHHCLPGITSWLTDTLLFRLMKTTAT
jgi:hypothetical protein